MVAKEIQKTGDCSTPRYSCPWCGHQQTVAEIKKCSGFTAPYTREEIMDAYFDPTDYAKRERLLNNLD